MTSDTSSLVLLHGVTCTGGLWQDIVPPLSEHYEVHTPTMLGHRGGPAIKRRPVTVGDVVDATERYLDEHNLERPHLAGNSLGGWVSVELARRGRAASVCALSPAGFWWDSKSHKQVVGRLRRSRALGRFSRPIAPLMLKSATVRRIGMREAMCRGDHLSAERTVSWIDDMRDCPFFDDYSPDEQVAPMDPLPCPVTLAWSQVDRIVPAETYGKTARERLPGATWVILPGVGHIPWIDDPDLVVRTILATTGATGPGEHRR